MTWYSTTSLLVWIIRHLSRQILTSEWASDLFFSIFSGSCYIHTVPGEFSNYWKNWAGVSVTRIFNLCACLLMRESPAANTRAHLFIAGIIEVTSKAYDFLTWWIVSFFVSRMNNSLVRSKSLGMADAEGHMNRLKPALTPELHVRRFIVNIVSIAAVSWESRNSSWGRSCNRAG